jgi:hypothetical protein
VIHKHLSATCGQNNGGWVCTEHWIVDDITIHLATFDHDVLNGELCAVWDDDGESFWQNDQGGLHANDLEAFIINRFIPPPSPEKIVRSAEQLLCAIREVIDLGNP